ncbi:protein kinase domain-containing protein [Parendozoicomonas haliclonae]|uniref:protein kinase domain-containing protein n=1 Tax=Parendozoicomonas haliclonae TaxID=1960125 RepID=UPI0013FD8803|nr:protein kinase [Parendozoicomonas haliclonae]
MPELTEKLTAAERGELRNKYSQKRLLDTSTANYLYALRLRSGATPRDIVIKAKQVGFADSDIQHEADILTSLKHSAIICSLFTLSTKTGMALVLPRYECALDQALLGKSKCIPANTFTFEFICKTMSDIGEGLIYMHDKGIYHNDLRADNILLDKQKYAVICDFDLASTARDPEVKLDPRFAFNTVVAPEIYDKKKGADHVRVDIFGACSILHSMLSKHTAALYCKWVEHYGSKYSRVHRDKGVNALHWRLQGKPNSAQAAFVHDHVALKGLRLNPNDRQSSMTDVLKGLKPPS